ncbi:MAG: FAD-binding oxidoreductase [Anaerolineales bacterium]|nr:FAD-binding oxidoreductase [Anaerolineales bacterium]NUQ86425.1 FAD-binding oxidoreductase [Anaerolineales bacterium]
MTTKNRPAKLNASSASPSTSDLRALFNGRVIASDDPRYESARKVFAGNIDRRPAAIVRVADAGDVSRLVKLAGDYGFELAIRSGGHSGAGHSTTEGGIVLDLSDMKDLQINPDERTAWAQTGLTAAEYTLAANQYGLATGFGDTGSVGLGGITLGGGVGYLVRKYGLTIDSLLAAEVVTADGQLLHVDEKSYPDLFWAIRGGGGNFGVATRFKFRLHDVSQVYGGMLILPATADIIASIIGEADSAPDELSGILNIMPAPPLPFLSPEHHGKMVVWAIMVYAGDPAKGEQVFAPFRKLAARLADMVKPMSYPEIYPPEEGGYHPVAAARTMFLDHVTRADAELILDRIQRSSSSMAVTQLRVLGGAMARIPADATAFAHRQSKIMANLAALYEKPEEKEVHEEWVAEFFSSLQQSDKGMYVNFVGDESEASVRAAYPGATWDKLRQVKTKYDPDNLFRLNQNIPPLSWK